ncbi:hypothetical protein HPY42_01050 [Coprothermobacteraceae bacterium]|nr:hypothetical protein [Coprothermobacteraceae bacterium]
MGVEQHGQDPTRAAEKAVRDAVMRVCIPGLREIFGQPSIKLTVHVGVSDAESVDVDRLKGALPLPLEAEFVVEEGGLKTKGIAMPELGDTNDQMYVAVAAITVWVQV